MQTINGKTGYFERSSNDSKKSEIEYLTNHGMIHCISVSDFAKM